MVVVAFAQYGIRSSCHSIIKALGSDWHLVVISLLLLFGCHGICSIWCLFVIVICSIWCLFVMPFDLRIWYLVIKAYAKYDVCLTLSFAPYDIWSSCHLIHVYDIWLSRHMLNMMFVCHCHLLYMRFGHHGICSVWYLDIMAFAQYDVWLS